MLIPGVFRSPVPLTGIPGAISKIHEFFDVPKQGFLTRMIGPGIFSIPGLWLGYRSLAGIVVSSYVPGFSSEHSVICWTGMIISAALLYLPVKFIYHLPPNNTGILYDKYGPRKQVEEYLRQPEQYSEQQVMVIVKSLLDFSSCFSNSRWLISEPLVELEAFLKREPNKT